jgi:ribosome assembly protein YihI (activator of Der GTPase)
LFVLKGRATVAIATEGRQTITMLRRRKDESFKQLLARLDTAIASATFDDVYVDERKVDRRDVHSNSLGRSKPRYRPARPRVSSGLMEARTG